MNKKIGMIAGGILLVLVVGIIGFVLLNGRDTSPQTLNSESQNQISGFNTIQDIFTNKSLSLTCEYAEENGTATTTYVKSGMVRAQVHGTTPEESGDVIIRDNTMYFWNENMGIKMTFDPETMTSDGQTQNTQAQQSLENLERYKESCKVTPVDDSLFVVPSNVTFQDMSGFLQALPSGAATGDGSMPSQEEIEALIQQYQR